MGIAGFDVAAFDAVPIELSDTVALVTAESDRFNYTAPPGGPDGAVTEWIVPAGVDAITFALWGGQGGFANWAGIAAAPQTRTLYSRRWPVTAGDVVTMCAGGPAASGNPLLPTLGNGPVRGGEGGTDGIKDGGAGGGASAIWINGTLIALAGGGGGYAGAGAYTGPTNGLPDGTDGALSLGDPLTGTGGHGAGGGGAPGGAQGAYNAPGDNGASVPCTTDAGGPASPAWDPAEADFDTATGLVGTATYREQEGRVLIWFYLPPAGINVGFIGV